MRTYILLIVFLLIQASSYSQSILKGKVVDIADSNPLTQASVILLNQDSILKYHTRVDESGNFQFKNVKNDNYIFLVTYPKFELYAKNLTITENTNVEKIALSSQANLIEEVIVRQRLPIRIKGDTIEYDAGSFETEKNAKLEDLLRRLPGLTVSGNGAITAQGKTVSKVLIDGEEFFGYDPKIAIRNVRADAVDKVQIYERKSEEAELTGIDDGQRFQTVNVVLKEEARKGIFGNAEALLGTENLYTGNLFAAKFNRTERIGLTANTNNMGGSSGREGDLRNNSRITGDPRNTSIGANYENQFLKKKLNVNGNYNFNNGSNRNETTNYNKEVISPSEIQETNSTSNTENTNQGHTFNARFRYRIDSTSNLNVDLNAKTSTSTSETTSANKMTDGNSSPIRDFNNNNQTIGNNSSNEVRLNYRKRLNSNGRSINIHLNNNYSASDQESNVIQYTYFYRNDSTVNINQNRVANNKRNNFNTQLQFSDRITQKLNYAVGYNLSSNQSTNKLDAYDNLAATALIDLNYSQNQQNNNYNHGIITNLNFNSEKYNINVANRTNYKDQKLIDTYRNINLGRNFWDNDVNASLNYRISNRKNLNVSYQNNFDIPSFGQLHPLQPQTNPIFIQEGNPDLQKASNNALRLNYNTMSLLKGTSWNINSSIAIKSNPIVNKRTIDINSITTSTYINVEGKSSWNANVNSNYSKPIFAKRVQLNFFSSANYNNGFSFIRYTADKLQSNLAQYELANTQNTNIATGLSINEQNSKGIDFDLSWRVSANNQRNSLQKDLNYTNLSTGGNGYIKYFFPKQFNVLANMVYNYEGPTKFYDQNIQQFYTNLAVEKKLLKSQSLTASIKAYDIFNTYNNINRNVSDTNFSESTQLVLTRYILFGLKWDFNKNLGKKKDE